MSLVGAAADKGNVEVVQALLEAYNAKTGEKAYQQRIAGKGGSFSASQVAEVMMATPAIRTMKHLVAVAGQTGR